MEFIFQCCPHGRVIKVTQLADSWSGRAGRAGGLGREKRSSEMTKNVVRVSALQGGIINLEIPTWPLVALRPQKREALTPKTKPFPAANKMLSLGGGFSPLGLLPLVVG